MGKVNNKKFWDSHHLKDDRTQVNSAHPNFNQEFRKTEKQPFCSAPISNLEFNSHGPATAAFVDNYHRTSDDLFGREFYSKSIVSSSTMQLLFFEMQNSKRLQMLQLKFNYNFFKSVKLIQNNVNSFYRV
ncbi:hypothetical protein Ocin01_14467 [Orchesella cincta]|uniref:Uncharacterized protein n=1 Tax=Orchesella cincta TaxID=48709 RepID=A0A1D2MGT3_ORCCI|nr:hypothetical protein Ocin01_14467 [Orchesella cincta]